MYKLLFKQGWAIDKLVPNRPVVFYRSSKVYAFVELVSPNKMIDTDILLYEQIHE